MRQRWILIAAGGAGFAVGVVLLAFGIYTSLNDDGGPPVSDAPIIDAASLPTATAALEDTETPPPEPPLGDEPYRMVIEKIGVDAPVRAFGLDEEQAPEIPTGDDAASVVAWYDFSAKPGVGSNAVFAGHVTWFGNAVFYSLPDLVNGDQIILRGEDGTQLTYAVSNVFRVRADDPNGRDVMFPTSADVLTIITCDGVFTPDPNDHEAGGNYDNRLVVRADLVSVSPPV
jgi:LPXTG-site transpeptidase (sortase) family protein